MHLDRGRRSTLGTVGRLVRFLLIAIAAVVAASAAAVPAQAAGTVTLKSVGAKKKPTSLVTFNGRAGKRSGTKVTIQRKSGGSWTVIAKGRTGKRGAFALTWITPSRASAVTVRAAQGGGVSAPRSFRVLKPAKGAKKIKVSKKTRVISPSAVQSVPAAGQPGTVTYAGGNDAAPGQIMVVGQGDATPDGFIGKVTKVAQKDGDTVVTTVPASLLDAVPEGSMDLATQRVTASGSRAHRSGAASVTCEGSVGASITHDITFNAGLDLKGDWTVLGGLQSASLTASAGLTASVKAALTAAGSCSLAQRALLTAKGPSISAFVGPVPVVMTSKLTVYLDANASAQGSLSTGASAGFDASAGVAWTKAGGFQGVQSFTPHFNFDAPALSASASAAVNITPTVDVLLYGIVGPRIALRTGVEFNADIAQNPWWSLDVPVDLTASISIAPLNLTSPELHVYQHSFPIADAGSGFGSAPEPLPPVHNVATPSTSIAVGYAHSCALRSSGSIVCWGANTHGQLGTGNKTPSSTPVSVSGITDAAAVVSGNDHSCALRVAGEVLCWGENTGGQLGNGNPADQPTPAAVSGITNAIAIAAGDTHTCAVLQTGRVKCWGANDQTQLGDGTSSPSASPVDVSGINNAASIGAGTFHTCVVLKTGGVKCWGNNVDGSLGNGTKDLTSVPVAVSGITNATAVDAGTDHTCALLATGGVSCWGMGSYGQIGDGANAERLTPTAASGITNAVAIGVGGAHSCAVLATGAAKCWGWNNYGQIGDGGMPTNRPSPVAVTGIANASGISGGLENSCSLLTTGGVKCWGYGVDGELGNGGNTTQSTPVAVTGLP